MADTIGMAFGGTSDAQKQLEQQQQQQIAQANQSKVESIQQDLGSQTRDLVRRYGMA